MGDSLMPWERVASLLFLKRSACVLLALVITACAQPTQAVPTPAASVPPQASATAQPATSTAVAPTVTAPVAAPTAMSTPEGPCKTSYPGQIEPEVADRTGWCAIDNDHVHVTYPDDWTVGLMGAAGQNRLFETQIAPGNVQTVRLVFSTTDLPLEEADKAVDGGYELSPSQPFVNPHETTVARYLKTARDKKTLVLITNWDGTATKRYFLVDQKTLLIFEVTPPASSIDSPALQMLYATIEEVIAALKITPLPAKG
jgi:hypothetical protein